MTIGKLDFERTGRTFKVYGYTGETVCGRLTTWTLFEVRCGDRDPQEVNDLLFEIIANHNLAAKAAERAAGGKP